MAQLPFPSVSIGMEGNCRRKLLNSNETARKAWRARRSISLKLASDRDKRDYRERTRSHLGSRFPANSRRRTRSSALEIRTRVEKDDRDPADAPINTEKEDLEKEKDSS
jgi:hypothetical protein